jgi:dienelactone hydrolase
VIDLGKAMDYGIGDAPALKLLAQVVTAGQTLARHPRAGAVGLFGWSFGGAMALVVAALQGPDGPFAAVAAHAGADRITPSFDPVAFRAGRGFLDILPEAPRAFVWEGFNDHLAPGAPLPLERLHLPVFLSVGLADPVWPAEMTLANAARLTALGRPPEVFAVPGQGHGFDFDREPELWARLRAFFGQMFDK